jgi:predicted nucleic acid-binding protein
VSRRAAHGTAFVDSGAFISFLDASDHQHVATRALFASPPRRLVTSALVVSETYGWFLHRLGEDAARRFRSFLADLRPLVVLAVDSPHLGAVGRTLDAHRGRKLTFVDASSLAFLSRHGLRTVWGTDRDLALEGATVLPGPSPPR